MGVLGAGYITNLEVGVSVTFPNLLQQLPTGLAHVPSCLQQVLTGLWRRNTVRSRLTPGHVPTGLTGSWVTFPTYNLDCPSSLGWPLTSALAG